MNDDEYLSEEEFAEVFRSLSEDERIEVCRKLFEFSKENREALNISEEKIIEDEEKLVKFEKVHEQKKALEELKNKLETQLELVAQRIEARLFDQAQTKSDQFFGDDPKRSSH